MSETKYGGDVIRVLFLVSHELECHGPRPGHTNQDEAGGGIDGVAGKITWPNCVVVDGRADIDRTGYEVDQ